MTRKGVLVTLVLSQLFALFSISLADTCNVAGAQRLDCGWNGINEGICKGRSCCWRSTSNPYPWCFYDSATANKLKANAACEHDPPVALRCNGNETISIHDVFYGLNTGNRTCHNFGGNTCFNPNATEIVRNICKDNSTCLVSPRGSIWNFERACDALNAQLVVHYICVLRAMTSSISAILPTPSSIVLSRVDKKTSTSEYVTVGRTEVSALLETVSTLYGLSSSPELSSSDSTSLLFTSLSSESLSPGSTTSISATATSVATPSLTETPDSFLSTSTESLLQTAPATVGESSSETSVLDITPISPTQGNSLTETRTLSSTESTSETQTDKSFSVSQTSQGTTPSSDLAPSLTAFTTETYSFRTASTGVAPSSSSRTKMSMSISPIETYRIESSSYWTQSSSFQSISSQKSSVLPSLPTMKTHSSSLSSTLSTSTAASPSSVVARITRTVVSASTSRAITSSVPTTNPPSVSNKNKGNQRTTTYIIIGVCVGVGLILCLAFVVWNVKKRQNPQRHNIITNDVLVSPQGTYYGLSMNDTSPGYDNPVKVNERDGPEIVMNQLYEMTPS